MKKDGFTLLELLVVIAIMAVVGVASVVMFSTSTEESDEDDLIAKYKEIQSSALVFIDLNDSWLTSFTNSGEIYVRLGEMQNENYLSSRIINPITGEEFPSSYLVKVYKTNLVSGNDNTEYVDSCIISNSGGNTMCISNSKGNSCECCDLPISEYNPAC